MKIGYTGIATVFVGFALAGCMPHPAPVVAPPNVSGPLTIARTVIAGSTIRLAFNVSMNPDCTVRSIPILRVLTEPMHGTTAISETEDFPSYPPANIRSVCNKAKARGVKLEYTPAPGYLGSDYLSYEMIFEDGVDRTVNIPLTVK
jgi:hypothetical protein